MGECIFCKIAAGEMGTLIYEDDAVVAFRDASPQAPTHVLIVPRRHVANVEALTPEDENLAGRMVLVAQRLARELGIAASGYRLVVNTNADGGQMVYHFHMHLLGGRALAPHMG